MRIKVCGITRVEDVHVAADLGVDLIGLNFWPQSRRYVEAAKAGVLAAACAGRMEVVGVFVDAPVEVMAGLARQVKLDWIQLHGQEPPEVVAALAEWPVIRAFAVHDEGSLEEARQYAARCRALGRVPAAYLFDTFQPGQPGGTGRAFRWELLDRPDRPEPLILAGGLTPDNVGAAVRQARPWAVDVAGGVESAPGIKDAAKLAAFVQAARSGGGAQ